MSNLHEMTPEQEAFNEQVAGAISRRRNVTEYKATHPMYMLLNSIDDYGQVDLHRFSDKSYDRAVRLGLINSSYFITQAGFDFLSARVEL